MRKKSPPLYRGIAKRTMKMRFERRYGKKRGAAIYGAVVGKVHREQVAMGMPGAKIENVRSSWVKAHWSRRGRKRVRVKGHRVRRHTARIRAW